MNQKRMMIEMKLKELIERLKEFDENSEVWIKFSYYDSDEGECFDMFNTFEFLPTKSGEGKPVLNIKKCEYGGLIHAEDDD